MINRVKEAAFDFFRDEMATEVFLSKYSDDRLETPEEVFTRVADAFSAKEIQNGGDSLTPETVNRYLSGFKYLIPQGSILSSLGIPQKYSSLSNCTVLPPIPDSYGGICNTDQRMVHLFKRRCGVGIDISTLRPAGASVCNSARTSTGAISFMNRFSNTTLEVAQLGRRGALMISCNINHPDSLEFIKIKQDLTRVTGANVSVQVTNEFMEAVESDSEYFLRFPVETPKEYFTALEERGTDFPLDKLITLSKNKYVRKIKAKDYWKELVRCAHSTAEPGLMFRTRHDDYCPSNVYPEFKNVTVNPCGEIMMGGGDSCRLLAVNLFSFVKNAYLPTSYFDAEEFRAVIRDSVRIADDLVDLEIDYVDNILGKLRDDPESYEDKRLEIEMWENFRNVGSRGRRAGLGFTGLGDVVAALGFSYGSSKSLAVVEKIVELKFRTELEAQINLAIERGPFSGFNPEIELHDSFRAESWFHFVKNSYPDLWNKMQIHGRRSVSWSTVAPTGTISLLAGVTAGIEPLFKETYTRRKKVNHADPNARVDFTDETGISYTNFNQVHPKFRDWYNIHYDTSDTKKALENLSQEDMDLVIFKSPYYKSTAEDIDWISRVDLQAIVQKYTTHSISSTINLPSNVSVEEVERIYIESWKRGLKGITVYRDGCRSGILLKEVTKDDEIFPHTDAPKRPKILPCEVHHATVRGDLFVVIVGLLFGQPYEIFAYQPQEKDEIMPKGKGLLEKKSRGNYQFKNGKEWGSVPEYMNEEQSAITRLCSTSLRHGANITFIVEQLDKTSGNMFSFSRALSRILKKYIIDGGNSTVKCTEVVNGKVCEGHIVFSEGCQKCLSCGNSKCG